MSTVVDFADHALLDPPTNDLATEVASNYLICQNGGERVSVDEGLVKQWDGLWSCRGHLDKRHPQDFVRSVAETSAKGSVSPELPDSYISTPIIEPPVESGDSLVLEVKDGYLILEDGSRLLLETGATTNSGGVQLEESGTDILILENGDRLILEE